MTNMNEKNREIMKLAAEKVINLSLAEFRGFAEKENVTLDEKKLDDAVKKFMHSVNDMMKDIVTE